jgi:hypothetical protein
MNDPRASRLVEAALRCYPARWRRRHADEAAELATLLIRDGTPARSIAWSYLVGAAREWLTPRPGRRLSTVACALLVAVCSLGVSVALLASTQPARAVVSPSRPPAPAHCPPRPASHAADAVPASGHPQLVNRGAGHDRPC